MPAAARREHTLTAVVVHIPAMPAGLSEAAAGIATYDARTGADFAWVPLTAATTMPDGSLTLQSTTRVRGELEVAFASAPEWARHSYLARVRVDARASANSGQIDVELPVVASVAALRLPDGIQRAGPLRLSRCDDPQWLPTVHSATGIEVLRGKPTYVWLGAGCYELLDPIDATRRQRFDIPSGGPIEITATLTAAPADHP